LKLQLSPAKVLLNVVVAAVVAAVVAVVVIAIESFEQREASCLFFNTNGGPKKDRWFVWLSYREK